MDFADLIRLETIVVTIAATGVPQRVSGTSIKSKFVAIERISGTPRIGNANNQVLSSMALNANNQWLDLHDVYVSGTVGEQFGVVYSRTYK